MKNVMFALALIIAMAFPAVAQASTAPEYHVPTLMYHRIACATSTTPNAGLYVCPSDLDAQMALLESEGWHSITADELATDMENGVCPGPKTFVISVDDGARDGYDNGYPIWKAHGFVATFYIVVNKVGDYLKSPKPSWYNPDKPHFSWDQAREMMANGFGFGNHTFMHKSLASSSVNLSHQLLDAEDIIVDELGIAPKTMAYPYGSTSDRAAKFVANHFTVGYTTKAGADETTAPELSPRIRVSRGQSPASVLSALNKFKEPC